MKTKYILIAIGIIAAIAGILIYLDMTAWNNAISTAAANTTQPANTSTEPTPATLEPAGELVLPQYITPETVADTPILIQEPVKNPGGSPAPNTTLEAAFYPPAD